LPGSEAEDTIAATILADHIQCVPADRSRAPEYGDVLHLEGFTNHIMQNWGNGSDLNGYLISIVLEAVAEGVFWLWPSTCYEELHTGRPLRAPGRLLQGSFLEVSLALVGVLYLPGLIPILEDLAEECNQKLYFLFGVNFYPGHSF